MSRTWTVKRFKDLTPDTLYELLQLQVDVFVVEQACSYPELDGKDRHPETRHLWTRAEDGEMAACARVLPPGLSYPGASIGRVAVAAPFRGMGLAHELMETALFRAGRLWPGVPVQIGAQAYLEDFYSAHGFVTVSEPYLEDDIPHIDMILNRT